MITDKEKYRLRILSNLCTHCGKPVVPGKKSCQRHLDEAKLMGKLKREKCKNKNLCYLCGKERNINGFLCSKCKSVRKNYTKKYMENEKQLILDHYGGKCFCCGEKNIKFLTIDHINNDGYKYKKQTRSGCKLYRWIIKNNFPENIFQLACYNCNCARSKNNGICPHQQKLIEEVGIIGVGLPTQEEKT